MKDDLRKIDKLLLFLVTLMCIFGLVMIYSASSASTILRYYVAPNHFFIRQLLVLVVGFIFGFFVTLFPTNRYKFYLSLCVMLTPCVRESIDNQVVFKLLGGVKIDNRRKALL